MCFAYVLYSQRLGRYYIGSTINVCKRLKEHNGGKSTFTKKGMPWKLVYCESLKDKKEAYKREFEIKRYKGGFQFEELLKSGGVA